MSASSSKKPSKHPPRNTKKTSKPTSARSSGHRSADSSKSTKYQDAAIPSTSSDTSTSFPAKREISIRVIDDCKNEEETFSCPYDTLISKMPYFKACLDVEPEGELTISVHCDITVFKKIMDYINSDATGTKKFKFDPKYAIHLLVSADFLQMDNLVEECLNYCHRHMNSIIENNCPIGALNDDLLTRLAILFNHREVESLKDPSGQIKEKLYKILLDRLLKPEVKATNQRIVPKLIKCVMCEQIFASKLQEFIPCRTRKATIGPRGELIYVHKRDMTWNLDRYLEDFYQSSRSWRKIYWRIWGLINSLHCTTCGSHFCCSDFTKCPYHRDAIVFPQTDPNENCHKPGTFPCCGAKSYKYDPIDPLFLFSGCAYRNHTVNAAERSSDIFQDMLTYFDLICIAQPTQPIPNDNVGLDRITPCHSERALVQWLRALEPDSAELKKVASKLSVSSDGSGSVTRSAESLAVGLTRKEEKPTIFTSLLSSLSQAEGMPDARQIWKPGGSLWHNQDAVREHDARQMELLMIELQKIQCNYRIRHSSPGKTN